MNPFLHRVPENEREEYFDETTETVLDQFNQIHIMNFMMQIEYGCHTRVSLPMAKSKES